MTNAFRRVAQVACTLILAGLFQTAPARANIVFDFSAPCLTVCTGTATAVLTLADAYKFGSAFTAADLVSFEYSSSSIHFDLTSADDPIVSGGLNADGSYIPGNPNAAPEVIFHASQPVFVPYFQSSAFEYMAFAVIGVPEDSSFLPSGFKLVTGAGAVPEPSTWAMMLLGFAGLGYAGYRSAKSGVSA